MRSSANPQTDGQGRATAAQAVTSPSAGAVLPWLAICPLLAGADTLVHGLVLGLVALLGLAATELVIRRRIVRGGTGATGLLLLGGGLAIILRLACEALAFELALAVGGLFALVALQGAATGCGSPAPGTAQSICWWRTGLVGALALTLTGALRDVLGPAGGLPLVAFFLLAGCAVAWNAWQMETR